MSLNLDCLTEMGKSFRKLLDVTKQISLLLDSVEKIEELNPIVDALKLRETTIKKITEKQLEWKNAGEYDPSEEINYNKQLWLCREIAKKVSEIDRLNMKEMEKVMKDLMNSVKTTKDSLKVINAYHNTMGQSTERSSW